MSGKVIMKGFQDFTIAVADTGDGDIVGTTKKNALNQGFWRLAPNFFLKFSCRVGFADAKNYSSRWLLNSSI